jgi:hypothetical protein
MTVSGNSIKGEFCGPCRRRLHFREAAHKVEEVTAEPRHPLTEFLCSPCFRTLMGPAATKITEATNA